MAHSQVNDAKLVLVSARKSRDADHWDKDDYDVRLGDASGRVVGRATPLRRPNAELRPREHLTEREVEALIEAAKLNRWGQRDSTMVLIAFRHGLRASCSA